MKPIAFDIQLRYKCPKCGSLYWVDLKEAKTPGFKIVCCTTLHLTTVKKVDITVQYNAVDSIAKEAYQTLKEYGYTLQQIKKTQEVLAANSKEELVAKFLKLQC